MVSIREALLGVFSELRKWMNMSLVYIIYTFLMGFGGVLRWCGSCGWDIY